MAHIQIKYKTITLSSVCYLLHTCTVLDNVQTGNVILIYQHHKIIDLLCMYSALLYLVTIHISDTGIILCY
jgi:hypothetical protein